MITYDVNVLIGASKNDTIQYVKCHDTGVNLRVFLKTKKKLSEVRTEEKPYKIPENSTVILKIAKPDKTYVLVDGSYTGSCVFFALPPQAFTVAGVSHAEVSIYGDDGRRITSSTFYIEAPKECVCDCDQESGSYVDIFAEQIQAAKDATSHPPIIGENGNYFIWDSEVGKYVDSGSEAFGDGIKSTDYATKDKGGTVRVDPYYGIANTGNGNGKLWLVCARDDEIDGRENCFKPIVPANLAYAVRSVGDNCYATIETIGHIETALDSIIAIQENLIGGGA